MPPGLLAALEIGNEPDLYAQARTFRVGSRLITRGQPRPTGYAYPDYRAELQNVRGAVEAAAPGAPLAAGGFASASWEDNEDDLLGTARESGAKRLQRVTGHRDNSLGYGSLI